MSAMPGQAGIGGRRGKREVIDVAETKVQDKSLDKLIHVRKQRLNRLEMERNEARESWRAARAGLRAEKLRWREGVRDAAEFWRQARAEFFEMATTSGQFRKAKAIHARMKSAAAELYLQCRRTVESCKNKRSAFYEARKRVLEANKQQEKLGILRDEIRLSNLPSES